MNDVVYVIYTSGSTGRPKGVIIEHKSLCNYLLRAREQYAKVPLNFPLYSSISFDLTVTSIFLPLITGGKLVVYPANDHVNIMEQIIEENECNAIKLTPSHILLIKDIDIIKSDLKVFIVRGEKFFVNNAQMLCRIFPNQIEIYNDYGPTEATISCMIYRYDEKKNVNGVVPIGHPIHNTRVCILDKKGRELPLGVTGDLYIEGAEIARGYVNILN